MDFPEPVISMAIEPKTQAESDKLKKSLDILVLEDPTFRVTANEETGQMLISGMGELHLEILKDRLLREFRVDANVGSPQVSYRESVSQEATGESVVERLIGGQESFWPRGVHGFAQGAHVGFRVCERGLSSENS